MHGPIQTSHCEGLAPWAARQTQPRFCFPPRAQGRSQLLPSRAIVVFDPVGWVAVVTPEQGPSIPGERDAESRAIVPVQVELFLSRGYIPEAHITPLAQVGE